jgi:hypothetical protein
MHYASTDVYLLMFETQYFTQFHPLKKRQKGGRDRDIFRDNP